LKESYGKSQAITAQIAEVDINQAYKNFMNNLPKPDKKENTLNQTIEYYKNIRENFRNSRKINQEFASPKSK